MQQYPADHPLWSDINFTPEWLYQSIRQEAAAAPRPAPRQTITGPRRFAKHCVLQDVCCGRYVVFTHFLYSESK